MATMGDSTKRRLSAVVSNANAGGGGGGRAPGAYVGGFVGGSGGTFGKAGRGLTPEAGALSQAPPPRPLSAGRERKGDVTSGPRRASASGAVGDSPIPQYQLPSHGTHAEGRRDRVRPASAGAKNVWDMEHRELPKAPPPGLTTGKVRPKSATMAKTTKPLAGMTTVEYRLVGQGIGLEPTTGRGASTGARGANAGGVFGTPPDKGKRPPSAGRPYSPYSAPKPPMPPGASPADPIAQRMQDLRMNEAEFGAEISEAHLATLEDNIRDAVRQKRSVYEGSKEMLLKLFKAVDDGSGDVSLDEFRAVCAQVGVDITTPEAQALFRRFGYGQVMPYQKFAHTLLTQPSRQMATEVAVRKGAFVAGQAANFEGKILYPQCRKPVYTPLDWDPALAERSAELPNARLVLDTIYGYGGKDNTAQNLFYTSEGKVVYYTAGVGVVYQRPPTHRQYFFLGHSDDISATALCPAAVDHEHKHYPAGVLVATGQVTAVEEGPSVCIWDSRLGSEPEAGAVRMVPELVRLKFDKEARGFCALGFSPSGQRLVCVAMDNYHTVYVYDWRKSRELCSGRGQMGDPPQVYGVEWNPHELTHNCPPAFATFGKKHIKVWMSEPGGTSFTPKALSFGRCNMQNVTSVQWLPPRGQGAEPQIVAGVGDGSLYIFKGGAAIKCITAHRPGPSEIRADGQPAHSGVRGLRLIKDGNVLLSGGADGTILQWDVADGTVKEARYAGPSIQLQSPFGPGDKHIPCIRAMDYSKDLDRILVGTNHSDVLEVSESTNETLMDGHSSETWSLAFHPTKPHTFASVSDSGHVHVWDAGTRQMVLCAGMGWTPRCIAYSPAPVPGSRGHHVAVGGIKGHIKVLDEGANLMPVHECKDSTQGIYDLKYSPDGRYLATATYDAWLDVYNVAKGYQKVARCMGHSATVHGLDWSVDSSIIVSHSNDYELLFWNAKTGKQIPTPLRDLKTATWTSLLGFPVMGIWPAFSDGTDVNAVDASHDRQFLATADDKGLVKLFNYPCVVEDAPHRAYRGHSSHVMCVRWNCNDSLICSAGGGDWAVFQFRLVHIQPDAAAPPPAPLVWGPLDSTGRTQGWTRAPVPVDPGAAESSSATGGPDARGPSAGAGMRSGRPSRPSSQYGGAQHDMPPIRESGGSLAGVAQASAEVSFDVDQAAPSYDAAESGQYPLSPPQASDSPAVEFRVNPVEEPSDSPDRTPFMGVGAGMGHNVARGGPPSPGLESSLGLSLSGEEQP